MAQTDLVAKKPIGKIDWAKRGEAKEHKLRKRIFAIMLDGKLHSPNTLSKALGEPLGNVAYHIKILLEDETLLFIKGIPRRGAMEHFYRINKEILI